MKADARIQAKKLRQSGLSIKNIASKLNVSQSTASRWCSKIPLTAAQRLALETQRRESGIRALQPWIEKNRARRIHDIEEQQRLGKNDVGEMSTRDLFMLGLGLYWGEGYKRGSQEWGFTNSDPNMIRLVLIWLTQCYSIELHRIRARITINELYVKESKRILQFWSKSTGIPETQFSASSIIRGYGSIGRDTKTYTGTLRIKISRGTSLRRRIIASIATAAVYKTPNSTKALR